MKTSDSRTLTQSLFAGRVASWQLLDRCIIKLPLLPSSGQKWSMSDWMESPEVLGGTGKTTGCVVGSNNSKPEDTISWIWKHNRHLFTYELKTFVGRKKDGRGHTSGRFIRPPLFLTQHSEVTWIGVFLLFVHLFSLYVFIWN